MNLKRWLTAIIFLALTACSAPQTQTPTPLALYAEPSASPWLDAFYACAPLENIALRLARTPAQADLRLWLGAPPQPAAFLYSIGQEEIIVAARAGSPLTVGDVDSARALFAGDAVNVWALDSADGLMRAFEAAVMRGTPITSLARLAVSPAEMAQALSADQNAVGVLGQHSSAAGLRVLFSAGETPVLVETTSQPVGALASFLTCVAARADP